MTDKKQGLSELNQTNYGTFFDSTQKSEPSGATAEETRENLGKGILDRTFETLKEHLPRSTTISRISK